MPTRFFFWETVRSLVRRGVSRHGQKIKAQQGAEGGAGAERRARGRRRGSTPRAASVLPNVEQGITLGVLLDDKLVYCTKARLTNRFKGENALGGKRYKRKGVIGQVDLAELRQLELAFLKSVSGSGPGQLKDVEPYF